MLRTLSVAFFLLFATAQAQPLPAEVVDRDKPYGGHPRQVIDISARPLSTLKPAVLIIHGGSWQAGDKRTARAKTKYFLSEGFAVAAMNYRLHPEVTAKEQADDVAAAAVWLAKNADAYGIDPRQIYLAGHAAGAHLAALVGTDATYLAKYGATPADLGGVIALDSGAYDVPAEIASTNMNTVEGRTLRQVFGESPNFWAQVSPMLKAATGTNLPPFFVAHSAGRPNVFRQAKPFAASLRSRGAVAVLYESIGRDQESIYRFFGSTGDPTTEAALNFIRREANIPIERPEKGEEGLLPQVPWLFAFEAPETDTAGRRLTGTQVSAMTTHDGHVFAGNAYWNETEENRRGQIMRLDSREDRWQLDMQMPRGYTRVASMGQASFDRDSQGRPIETLDYLFVGATYEKERNKPAPAGIFIRTPSGNWAHQDIGEVSEPVEEVEINALGAWRDPKLRQDLIFAGANPNPLGIFRGVYNAAAPGGIKFDQRPEYQPRGRERIMGFASCGGRFYAATSRQILRRVDGTQPRWETMTDLEDVVAIRPYLEDLDIYWQKNYEISSFRCDLSRSKTTLAFTTLNRSFRYSPGDKGPRAEINLAALIRSELGREPHYVIASEASMMRRRGRDTEEWIGIEVYYDPNYLAARPAFPHWRTGFGKDAWYVVRTVIGGQVDYRLEEITIPGNNPNNRPLSKVATFARSPFEEDNAVYVGGFAPWFEDVTNTAWIARGEL
ncbi:MAG: alpha/beta hydrolase fold domain-containing protein [Parvularculaceae bacterium]|nr:alpha/beta hydrolase fold domain-containing protein [Parvularculaceae bacterium]